MMVGVCTIVKLENRYIKEWVEHYKSINVDNVIIYDNNDINSERVSDVVKNYIDDGFVIVETCFGKRQYQCSAYSDCIKKYSGKFDWIAFFDADEFLDIKDIKGFLNQDKFKGFSCIRIPWKLFNDSNIIETKGDYSIRKFIDFKYCRQCKSIIKPYNFIGATMSPHGPLNVNACDPNGEICMTSNEFISKTIQNKKYDVWLNHYMLKTIEEYVNFKMKRLYPDQSEVSAKNILQVERFFMLNELTPDKTKWLKEHGIELKMKDGHVDYIRDKRFYDEWFK